MLKRFAVLAVVALPAFTAAVQLRDAEPAEQAEQKDPTRPQQGVASVVDSGSANRRLELNSVLIGKDRKLAVINGELMKEGDYKRGVKLWRVYADRVLVSVAGADAVTVVLDSHGFHKEVR